jgi:hypothetical protein
MYWLFDNIYIIMKMMNVAPDKKNPSKLHQRLLKLQQLCWKISRLWWLLGLTMFLVYCIKTLRKTYTDESDLKVAALNKMTVSELKDNLQIISKLRGDSWVNFNRALSDLFICVNENNLPMNILGKRLNGGVEGLFGMASSVIYLYSLIRFK